MKDNKNVWYAPLSAQFQVIEEAMPLSRFAAIEAVLYLLALNAPDSDPTKAYLLFTQYQLISTTECTTIEHTLQQARHTLGFYRSQKYWQDDLRDYREPKYSAIRAFSFEELGGTVSFSKAEGTYPYPYEERQKEWVRFWPDCFDDSRTPFYAGAGTYRYVYPNLESGEIETVQVKFDNNYMPPVQSATPEKGYREPIAISLDDLLNVAKEMAKICPDDPCHIILKNNILKQIVGNSVQSCTEFTIREVVNIVGMVGAGKSTLIKVLAFWCHQNGYRIVIVVDTVAEVLNLQKYLGPTP